MNHIVLLLICLAIAAIAGIVLAAITAPFIKHRATMNAFGLPEDPAPQPTPTTDTETGTRS